MCIQYVSLKLLPSDIQQELEKGNHQYLAMCLFGFFFADKNNNNNKQP